jgi:von willebrand factor type A domain
MVDVETPELLYPFVLMLVLFAGMLGLGRWLKL